MQIEVVLRTINLLPSTIPKETFGFKESDPILFYTLVEIFLFKLVSIIVICSLWHKRGEVRWSEICKRTKKKNDG